MFNYQTLPDITWEKAGRAPNSRFVYCDIIVLSTPTVANYNYYKFKLIILKSVSAAYHSNTILFFHLYNRMFE